jgi:hypothetical protein
MSLISPYWDDLARRLHPLGVCKTLVELFWRSLTLTATFTPRQSAGDPAVAVRLIGPDTAPPVFDAFMSYSIEFAFWPDFAGMPLGLLNGS